VSIRPSPNLRSDASYHLLNATHKAIDEAIKNCKPIYRSCINCEHFDELNGEICKLAKARPPARVIAYACERWEDIEVPF